MFPTSCLEDCVDHVLLGLSIVLLKGCWQVPLTDHSQEICASLFSDGGVQSWPSAQLLLASH